MLCRSHRHIKTQIFVNYLIKGKIIIETGANMAGEYSSFIVSFILSDADDLIKPLFKALVDYLR